MQRLLFYFLISLSLTLSAAVLALEANHNSSKSLDSIYKLGAGDLLSVQVFGEPDLSFSEIRLTDAGTFSYPFLGEVRAKGLTSADVERSIKSSLLGDYLIDPKVTVRILEYRSFFVNGEVKKPGGYPFKPGLTLRKAIAIAGGFTERASRSKFYIIRDNDEIRKPIRSSLDSNIYPGDIVTVDESFF
ncbi:polysaccharide biosynthesis/export family protein [Zhongshania sp.]|uniref:polysaccharide biosynthesis/export family protein n=1 Tax=Zhongshania sp. TaxID=1971902 RepID=UPI003561302C